MSLVDKIDALLPQTQCGECSYPGCLPYAQALAQGKDTVDRCPPGGVSTVVALANLLNIDSTPYLKSVAANTRQPSLAVIRDDECIGCTKCIQACPVDAIIGAAKQMHSIINSECTGCGLCVEPCPVDCIDIKPLTAATYDKDFARTRHDNRQLRLLQQAQAKERSYQDKRQLAAQSEDKQQDKSAKQQYIEQALARVKAKKNNNE